ncbi:MAG TPA: biotin carboxylase N-terminal domain-containing protein [Actinomycetota bacterium]|nr:biotin carboxylase N-terminal domain-containing protein [Actinomycetota bacterium]
MFSTVLVANRAEIACRVLRTLRRLGVRSVAVFSEVDARARHVREADAAEPIGDSPAPASYLNPAAIIEAALRSGAEAVHPGYGFLSESPRFAAAVVDAGLAWIGPSPDVLELTGDKAACREAFARTGFPVLPGAGPFVEAGEALEAADGVGFPIMVKAVMGGGGIGMSVARDHDELAKAVETASTRGARFFADPAVLLERYVEGARHVEVQVLADDDRCLHLYERECSAQRRHQKVVEETPSPALDDELRSRMCDAAVESMRTIGYRGAGTVECVVSPGGEFFLLEVNARLQVEHPVTELTLDGLDLVEQQLLVASGSGMSLTEAPRRWSHAIECRVYAEDPRTFLPSPGTISRLQLPSDVRADFGYDEGDEVPMFYDPLIGKLVVHSDERASAIEEMRHAVAGTTIEGLKTNLEVHVRILEDERFTSGAYDTSLLGK